ncbi:exodeoxyribonuclease VII small subunit [Aestuariibacter halophilus]|uniref:Exodeoxyribonuclease 7 small subunit n=1 Tax=Fluctibacter halophilus TaxID=226011 RepID=A0ABS8G4E9_9ALTE|nr:exodeoxyribonuclease VII small subunit [Aestuariibacter halophilus]MCC2614730.1 exodeoxyribonuclease VII small subunit [Aestuariibacter halophilus]
MNQPDDTPNFESAMQELETIVKQMEMGNLPLEEALSQFERGIQLVRVSQKKLQEAEQKVQVLMQQQGQEQLSPLTDDENDA